MVGLGGSASSLPVADTSFSPVSLSGVCRLSVGAPLLMFTLRAPRPQTFSDPTLDECHSCSADRGHAPAPLPAQKGEGESVTWGTRRWAGGSVEQQDLSLPPLIRLLSGLCRQDHLFKTLPNGSSLAPVWTHRKIIQTRLLLHVGARGTTPPPTWQTLHTSVCNRNYDGFLF